MATTAPERSVTVGNLIGGQSRSSGERSTVIDPGRLDDVVAQVAVATPGDVDAAVRSAHAAYLTWSEVDPGARAKMLLEASAILADLADELAPTLVREHGGLLWEAQADFAMGAGVLQDTARATESFFSPRTHDDERSFISIERMPRGVVAAVVPWNMPVVLSMVKLAPALATGNSVVLKTSPFAPVALTLALERVASLLPAGTINVVHGGGDVGHALVSHPLVRKVGFTGGTETAQHVMAAAATTIKNVTLELGGNDPAVVLDDADIDSTVDGLVKGVFTRSGQICFAVKRIYVPRARYEAFADAFCRRVDELVVGHGLDPAASFGPLNNKAQYDKVKGLIAETKNSSATVVELGRLLDKTNPDNGYYIRPHVVLNVGHEASISSCEQFGPIVPVIAYDDEETAIRWANDSEWGLCSSVWTSDEHRGLALARRLEAGSTFINSHSFDSIDLRMPFGGVKQSGIGREFGTAGMEEYVDVHSIRLLKRE